MKILQNFQTGIDNLFKVSAINILVLLCLILILIIIYLNTGSFELFTVDNSNYLLSFINRYIQNQTDTNNKKLILAQQEKTINTLEAQVIKLINTQL